jgi:hypothetical protein
MPQMSTHRGAKQSSSESTQRHHVKFEPQPFLPSRSGQYPPASSQSSLKRGGGCKGTPLMSSETSSSEPLPLSYLPLTTNSPGMTSVVLLVECTAEALPMTSDIPFIFICLFILYYDVIPSRHLSSYSHHTTFILFIIFIVRFRTYKYPYLTGSFPSCSLLDFLSGFLS